MNEQDQRVRDYYQSLSMPQERIDSLLQAEQQRSGVRQRAVSEKTFWKRFNLPVISWPAMSWPVMSWVGGVRVGSAAAMILMVSLWMHNSGTESERSQRTLQEVAMNHTTRLEPEYRGESLAMLDNSMQQLPFALVLPSTIDESYELVGSRYCSLAGELAAHVRLKNRLSGKPMSLFVTSNSEQLIDIPAQQSTLDGVDVKLWREGGLFFALAQRS